MSVFKEQIATIDYYSLKSLRKLDKLVQANSKYDFYMEKIQEKLPVRSQALIRKDDKFLIMKCIGLQRGDIFYTLPGGGLHEDESSIEAVIRESHEEIEVRVNVLQELAEAYDYTDNDFYIKYHTFLCEIESEINQAFESEETHTKILELIWVNSSQDIPGKIQIYPSLDILIDQARGV